MVKVEIPPELLDEFEQAFPGRDAYGAEITPNLLLLAALKLGEANVVLDALDVITEHRTRLFETDSPQDQVIQKWADILKGRYSEQE